MKKSFKKMVQKNPEKFDQEDSRGGKSAYPQASRVAATPEHVQRTIKQRQEAKRLIAATLPRATPAE